IQLKEEAGATDQRHRFTLNAVPIDLAIEVLDDDEPRAGVPYTLDVEGRVTEGTVPGDGMVRAQIYPSDRVGRLRVGEADDMTEYQLSLGELDPAHTRAGAVHRLWNLSVLPTADPSDEELLAAVELFQTKHALECTGELDRPTIDKLVELHGS
ncbi:MAG: hypothetical protein AAFX85_17545, partial [Pseudomonadota bacterium]